MGTGGARNLTAASLVATRQLVVLALRPIGNTSAEEFLSRNPQLY
jgi:hypothetical protein